MSTFSDMEEKLRAVEDLDARIARAKGAERQGLLRGAFIAAAMFAMLGAWPDRLDPVLFNAIRYGGGALVLGAEFFVRRHFRRQLELVKERRLGAVAGDTGG
jgi:hypothetical protein